MDAEAALQFDRDPHAAFCELFAADGTARAAARRVARADEERRGEVASAEAARWVPDRAAASRRAIEAMLERLAIAERRVLDARVRNGQSLVLDEIEQRTLSVHLGDALKGLGAVAEWYGDDDVPAAPARPRRARRTPIAIFDGDHSLLERAPDGRASRDVIGQRVILRWGSRRCLLCNSLLARDNRDWGRYCSVHGADTRGSLFHSRYLDCRRRSLESIAEVMYPLSPRPLSDRRARRSGKRADAIR